MSLKFYVTLCFLNLLSFSILKAQVPFAQVSQLPLQLNSSLAGAKAKNRICLGGNIASTSKEKQNNLALSYDQVVKSIGSGVGFYGMYNNTNNGEFLDTIKQKLPNIYHNNSYHLTNSKLYLGACMAPKYNFKDPLNPNKFKYTFSPSLYIEYGRESVNNLNQISSQQFYSTLFSSQYPNGTQHLDSTITRYVKYQISTNLLCSGLGFLFNSGKWMALAKMGFVRSIINERVEIHEFNKENNIDKLIFSEYQYLLYSFEPTAHIGYSVGYSSSKFSLTPLVGAGCRTYFNLPKYATITSENTVRSYDLSTRKSFEFNYLHASLNMRYGKVLLGTNFTQFNGMKYTGLSGGFQNTNLKILANVGQHHSSIDNKIYAELTACVMW
ncbi:MAG: hypothetical protein U0V72_11625 [Cytophagales bacterium]